MELVLLKIFLGIVFSFATSLSKKKIMKKYGITPQVIIFLMCFVAATIIYIVNYFVSWDTIQYFVMALGLIWGTATIYYDYVVKKLPLKKKKDADNI